jgi:hypothetical protein
MSHKVNLFPIMAVFVIPSLVNCGQPPSTSLNIQKADMAPPLAISSGEELASFKLRYSPDFSRKIAFDFHEYGLDILTSELHGGVTYKWQKSFSTSYAIEHVTDQTSERYVIGGLDEQTGEAVIEGWQFTTPTGGYIAKRSPSTAFPIGTPTPLSILAVTIEGGIFIPPSQRSMVAPPQKMVLYRGTGIYGLRALIVDPEGRYVLAQDDSTGSIYQVVNQQLSLLASVQEFPLLADNFLMEFFSDGTSDRVSLVFMESTFDELVLVLHDGDNDGIFDPPVQDTIDNVQTVFPLEDNGGPYRYDFRF